MLDFIKIHISSEDIAHDFMKALSDVEDTAIFKHESVKSIIEYRWGPCKQYIVKW